MTEESIKPLRSVARKLAGLWPLLTEEEQARVEAAMEVKHYKKNHLVYAEGESPDHLLAVLSGKVKISATAWAVAVRLCVCSVPGSIWAIVPIWPMSLM